MTSISKNVYIDKLDDKVNKYINTYHSTIKMKHVDVKQNILTLVKKLMINILNLKSMILLEYQNIKPFFAKGYLPNWSEEVFVITKVQNTFPGTYVISDLKDKEIVGTFYEKELQKTNQKEFRVEKVIKRKGEKLYVKWKSYYNSFNS